MRDKRPVDELTVEELERILAVRRREERQGRFRRMQASGRTVGISQPTNNLPATQHGANLPVQHERAATVPAPIEPTGYDLTQEVPKFEDEMVDGMPIYVSQEPSFIEPKAPPTQIKRRSRQTIAQGEKTRQQQLLSWGLLALEIAFIGGLAIILYRGWVGLQDIQDNTSLTQEELSRQIAAGRIQPSPTPILSAANHLISGGHSPPDENGNSQLNLIEIDQYVPEHLRPAVQREMLAPPITVEQRPNNPVALDIPALNINNASIVNGDSWEALKAGVGYRPTSGLPGSDQNVVLVGHNDIYGEIFRYLTELQIGDEIRIRDASGRVHTYAVSQTDIVDPDAVWVMDPNLGSQVTLITCYPYKVDDQRFIVFADLVE